MNIAELDVRMIQDLYEMTGDAFLDILKMHVASQDDFHQRLNAAVSQKSVYEMKEVIHAIKGSFSNIGALQFAGLCQEKERDLAEALEGNVDFQALQKEISEGMMVVVDRLVSMISVLDNGGDLQGILQIK